MTEPRPRSNVLLITLAVCAIAVSGLMLVVVVSTIGPSKDAAAATKTTSKPPTPAAIAPVVPVVPVAPPPPAPVTTVPTTTASASALDHTEVASEIVSVLQSDYGIDDISTVRCPNSMPVRVNAVYTCTLKVGGEPKHVSVQITDQSGNYDVSRPTT
ncbi:DUF4333 domain-containing protein [Nocardia sp. NPDC058058]|uniref:DUF4333 domain-containing protein n=1 Tax=Nocardia sp. NPDC058058 TaxID=3346317 RepID=UPI0036D98F8C